VSFNDLRGKTKPSTTTLRGTKTKFGNGRIDMKRILCCLLLLQTLALFSSASAQAQSGTPPGTFAFTLKGYTVQGQLTNAVIHPDKSVNMTMNIQSSLSSPIGAVPVSGSGEWYGVVNGSVVSGTIANVRGALGPCAISILCGRSAYVGNGTWTGTLSGTQGTGTFQATITFTNSTLATIPANSPMSVSGTWSSQFQNAYPVPEYPYAGLILVAALSSMIGLVIMRKRRK
jgi:hypothetical protein